MYSKSLKIWKIHDKLLKSQIDFKLDFWFHNIRFNFWRRIKPLIKLCGVWPHPPMKSLLTRWPGAFKLYLNHIIYLLCRTVVHLDWEGLCPQNSWAEWLIRKALVGGVSHCSFIKSQRRLQITPLMSYKTQVIKLEAQMEDQKIWPKFNLTFDLGCISAKLAAKSELSGCVCLSTRVFYKEWM